MSPPLAHHTVSAVKAIHAEVIAAHGGSAGLRDEALLESAVAAPQAARLVRRPGAESFYSRVRDKFDLPGQR